MKKKQEVQRVYEGKFPKWEKVVVGPGASMGFYGTFTIQMFSTEWCGPCDAAINWWKKKKVTYDTYAYIYKAYNKKQLVILGATLTKIEKKCPVNPKGKRLRAFPIAILTQKVKQTGNYKVVGCFSGYTGVTKQLQKRIYELDDQIE